MPATPCPGHSGCRCPYCTGLREYMAALTGADYGLPVTYIPIVPSQPEPALEAPVQLRPRVIRQPWDVRPARSRAA
jgi:hypothetical protein